MELAFEGDCAYKRHMFKNDLAGACVGENTDELCSSVWLLARHREAVYVRN